jgi:hypothetical protein
MEEKKRTAVEVVTAAESPNAKAAWPNDLIKLRLRINVKE